MLTPASYPSRMETVFWYAQQHLRHSVVSHSLCDVRPALRDQLSCANQPAGEDSDLVFVRPFGEMTEIDRIGSRVRTE